MIIKNEMDIEYRTPDYEIDQILSTVITWDQKSI